MHVLPCPECGRKPKIVDCIPGVLGRIANGKGQRKRICHCPNNCSVIPSGYVEHFYFEFLGEGDDNEIYKLWNKAVGRYLHNKDLKWRDKDFSDWRK